MTTYGGRFQVVSEIGKGGFGQVVHARDTFLDRDVAIKNLDPLLKSDPKEVERFRKEAKVLAQLSHPNLPAIYDVIFETKLNNFQIIFEYIRGTNLQEWIAENGPAPLEKALTWFEQLSIALDYAHGAGVIHRDVKPKNIIIGITGAYLVDFGIALTEADAERLTKQGYAIGTPGYMSPEQMNGLTDLDARTDIYNLGVCLYEVLRGERPDPNNYTSLSSSDDSIPAAIDDLVRACLCDREQRISSASEFLDRLSASLEPKESMTSVLTDGRLADLQRALSGMTATEFSRLPFGQRELIMTKVADVSESGNPRLITPLSHLLRLLLELGTSLDAPSYEETLDLSIRWGFDEGDESRVVLRATLAQVAPYLEATLHALLADKMLNLLGARELSDQEIWFLTGAREVVSNLMSNAQCDEQQARRLGSVRRQIDAAQRNRHVGVVSA